MWLLMAVASASRFLLASTTWLSASATKSLLASCELRNAMTFAALILFRTAISVFLLGLEHLQRLLTCLSPNTVRVAAALDRETALVNGVAALLDGSAQ